MIDCKKVKYWEDIVTVYRWTGHEKCLPVEILESPHFLTIDSFFGDEKEQVQIYGHTGIQFVHEDEYIMVTSCNRLQKWTLEKMVDFDHIEFLENVDD